MNFKLLFTAAVAAIALALYPYPESFNIYAPPPIPGSRDHLRSAEIMTVGGAVGPESIVFDPNGDGPYTGVADGRILKWQGNEGGWVDFASTSSQRLQKLFVSFSASI